MREYIYKILKLIEVTTNFSKKLSNGSDNKIDAEQIQNDNITSFRNDFLSKGKIKRLVTK